MWRNRLLLVFSVSAASGEYKEQLRSLKHEKVGFEDRNLLLDRFSGQEAGELDETQVSPDEVAGLRGAPGVPEERFAVVLIGKDDGEKHRSYTPL